ncbi:hypothetical protein GCM10023176_17150 [Micromonospora coerulea]|uniref:Uncharacterized protein n=1 Tax=Micromonospora coerulea TaxID=47856 RepID=A0ABP8SEU1_9ACTN
MEQLVEGGDVAGPLGGLEAAFGVEQLGLAFAVRHVAVLLVLCRPVAPASVPVSSVSAYGPGLVRLGPRWPPGCGFS